MNTEVIHEKNRFFKKVDGLDCELVYFLYDDTIEFYHTYVPEPLRGQGLAWEIIQEGLDYAIANNYRVIPSCSAVKKFMDRHPKYCAIAGRENTR
jgi:predicted GNAT family acetyltransferase